VLANVSFAVKKGEIFGCWAQWRGKSPLPHPLHHDGAYEGSAILPATTWFAIPAVRRLWAWFPDAEPDKALTVERKPARAGHLHGLSGAVLRGADGERHGASGLADPPQRPGRHAFRRTAPGVKSPRPAAPPQVLLMDEASSGLDPAARRDLSRHVETCAKSEASPSC